MQSHFPRGPSFSVTSGTSGQGLAELSNAHMPVTQQPQVGNTLTYSLPCSKMTTKQYSEYIQCTDAEDEEGLSRVIVELL